jgi:stage V sporulation protein G
MEISEVRVKLVNNPNDRLKAFCSITLEDDFVIRDLKIIDGANGTFVAMPSRKLSDRCQSCGHKNHLRARFCNDCGKKLPEDRAIKLRRSKLHADIAHPINSPCRERIQTIVVEAYEEELEKAKLPGYEPADIDDFDYDDALPVEVEEKPVAQANGADETTTNNGQGYSDLIADLKRNTSTRREERKNQRTSDDKSSSPPAVQKPVTAPPKPLADPVAHSEDSFGAGLV